jgi:hypothetical protein
MVIGLPLVSCRDGFVSVVLLKYIITIVLTNMPLGMPRALYSLFTVTCVVHFLLLVFSGCKYFLTFIDKFSRRTSVFFLKLKSDVFDKFLAYKALLEKQSRHQI